MPAARAFLGLGLATLLLAVAAVEPRAALAAVALDALVLVACMVDHARARALALQAERRWPPLLVQGAHAWRYALIPRQRGEHRAGPLTVRVLGPWGLAWSQRDLIAPEAVRVYPQ